MFRKSSRLSLGENLPSVDFDLENPAVGFDKFRPYAELTLDGVRQTGGFRSIVSNCAILN